MRGRARAPPRRSGGSRSASRAGRPIAAPNASRSRGSSSSTPLTPSLDLVLDAADGARDHRARLPHRLGHGQAEPLLEALLHDHRRVALQRVDDRRVLLDVLHRQAGEVHPAADLACGSPRQRLGTSASTSAPSGSSATASRLGPASTRWASRPAVDRSAKPRITPIGSLSRSQRETWTTSGVSAPAELAASEHLAAAVDPSRRCRRRA